MQKLHKAPYQEKEFFKLATYENHCRAHSKYDKGKNY